MTFLCALLWSSEEAAKEEAVKLCSQKKKKEWSVVSVNLKILFLPGYFGCFIKCVISFLIPNKHLLLIQDCTGDFVLISLESPSWCA